MKAEFLDKNGKTQPFYMGCYGIGIGRTAQAAIEQNNDEKGIIWPISIAPFEIEIVPLDSKDMGLVNFCDRMYDYFENTLGIEVLYDDRAERAGIKLNDMDLIGIPIRIVVGKKSFADNKVEISLRRNRNDKTLVDRDVAIEYAVELREKLYKELEKIREV